MSKQAKEIGAHDIAGIAVSHLEYRKLIHDLRNSLASILMQAQMLSHLAKIAKTDVVAIKKVAGSIEKNVKSMAHLLETA